MRRALCCFLLLLIVITAGCFEQPAPAPAPAPTPAPAAVVTLPPATIPTPTPAPKQVNFTVFTNQSALVVRFDGGPDGADLTTMLFRINNQNGQYIERTATPAYVGQEFVFPYRGGVDTTVVNIVGTFRDGTQQTILMKYL